MSKPLFYILTLFFCILAVLGVKLLQYPQKSATTVSSVRQIQPHASSEALSLESPEDKTRREVVAYLDAIADIRTQKHELLTKMASEFHRRKEKALHRTAPMTVREASAEDVEIKEVLLHLASDMTNLSKRFDAIPPPKAASNFATHYGNVLHGISKNLFDTRASVSISPPDPKLATERAVIEEEIERDAEKITAENHAADQALSLLCRRFDIPYPSIVP